MKSGITLSSLFFTIGPNLLSTDEIFQAFEYKALLSKCKEEKKKWKLMVKLKGYEEKVKRVLAINIAKIVGKWFERFASLEMADEFSNMMKGMKEQQLHALW